MTLVLPEALANAGMAPSVLHWYLLSMRSRLGLEIKGLKFRDGSTYAYLKREFGYKGSREKVYDAYTTDLREAGYLVGDA